jgi:hypothetical protein
VYDHLTMALLENGLTYKETNDDDNGGSGGVAAAMATTLSSDIGEDVCVFVVLFIMLVMFLFIGDTGDNGNTIFEHIETVAISFWY